MTRQKQAPDLEIKEHLAAISGTSPQDWFLISRLRHGLDLSLRVLKEQEGDGGVITQAFTCITAVNPIVTSGLTPIFCDISPKTLSLDIDSFEKLLSNNTKAAIIQHTFGVTADMAGVRSVVRKTRREILLIEDSAHCVGTVAHDDEGIPIADLSFHSFGAEKLLSTRFGGAVWINPTMKNAELRKVLVKRFSNLPKMGYKTRLRVRIYPPLNGLLNRLPPSLSSTLRHVLSSASIFVSPIMPIEQSARNFGHIERLSPQVMRAVAKELANYRVIVEHRQQIATIYKRLLKSSQYQIPDAVVEHDLPYVRFPLVCKTPEIADSLFHNLRQKGFSVGKWYRPLLFPGAHDSDLYGYNHKSSPAAEEISARIINLPTGPYITPEIAKEIAHAINR